MGRIKWPTIGRPKTIVQPKNATRSSSTAYKCKGRHRGILDDAAIAFPNARPAMKLERISAAAQIELPNAKPLSRNQSVSKIRAPVPDRNRTPQRTTTRPPCNPAPRDACLARDTGDFWELVNIAQRSSGPQHQSPGHSGKKRTNDNASFSCVNQGHIVERQ